MTYTEILMNIDLISSEGQKLLERETFKMTELISKDLDKIRDIANDYVKKVEQSKAEWKRVKKELQNLEEKRDTLQKLENELNDKIIKVNKEEENLINLHTVLSSRKKILDAREREIEQAGRSVNEKTATPV